MKWMNLNMPGLDIFRASGRGGERTSVNANLGVLAVFAGLFGGAQRHASPVDPTAAAPMQQAAPQQQPRSQPAPPQAAAPQPGPAPAVATNLVYAKADTGNGPAQVFPSDRYGNVIAQDGSRTTNYTQLSSASPAYATPQTQPYAGTSIMSSQNLIRSAVDPSAQFNAAATAQAPVAPTHGPDMKAMAADLQRSLAGTGATVTWVPNKPGGMG